MKLSEAIVAGLPVPASGAKLFPFPAAVRGFAVRVTSEDVRSFVLTYRAGGRQRSYTIGRWRDPWSVGDAVKEGRALRLAVDRGLDPLGEKKAARAVPQCPTPVLTLGAVLDAFMLGHAQKRLRRPDNHGSAFERIVIPALGTMPINELRRSHVKELLDGVAESSGPTMADRTLAYLRSALNWHANEHEDFALPRFAGLRWAGEPEETRALSDHEVRLLWAATRGGGEDNLAHRAAFPRPEKVEFWSFETALRFCLLTGQRKGEVFGMVFGEIDWSARQWRIPAQKYKNKRAHTVELSDAAFAIVDRQSEVVGDGNERLVFPSDRTLGRLGNGSSGKRSLDAKIAQLNQGVVIPAWKVHGLRSTARSLMARAGVQPHVAERVLGHLQGSRVERAYDQHDYAKAKREAGELLAQEIARIVENGT
jgi:integrase